MRVRRRINKGIRNGDLAFPIFTEFRRSREATAQRTITEARQLAYDLGVVGADPSYTIANNTIGLRFRNRRETLGMNPADLGKKLGMDSMDIISIEEGRHLPSAEKLSLASTFLGASPSSFFGSPLPVRRAIEMEVEEIDLHRTVRRRPNNAAEKAAPRINREGIEKARKSNMDMIREYIAREYGVDVKISSEELGSNIRRIMEIKGKRPADVRRKLNVGSANVSMYQSGRLTPTLEKFLVLAEFLETSPVDFVRTSTEKAALRA